MKDGLMTRGSLRENDGVGEGEKPSVTDKMMENQKEFVRGYAVLMVQTAYQDAKDKSTYCQKQNSERSPT